MQLTLSPKVVTTEQETLQVASLSPRIVSSYDTLFLQLALRIKLHLKTFLQGHLAGSEDCVTLDLGAVSSSSTRGVEMTSINTLSEENFLLQRKPFYFFQQAFILQFSLYPQNDTRTGAPGWLRR